MKDQTIVLDDNSLYKLGQITNEEVISNSLLRERMAAKKLEFKKQSTRIEDALTNYFRKKISKLESSNTAGESAKLIKQTTRKLESFANVINSLGALSPTVKKSAFVL